MNRLLRCLALVSAVGLGAPLVLAAQPVDSVFKGFHPVGDWELLVDGAVADAKVYQLERPPAYLVVSARLPAAVLLAGSGRTVETVPPDRLIEREDAIDLRADAVLTPSGTFSLTAKQEIAFTAGGTNAALRPREPLVGPQEPKALYGYSPEYSRLAKAYEPSGPVLERLRDQGKPVLVTIYFGTWCPHCKQMVPRMLRIAEELAGSKVRFAYYGLPRDITSDLKAKELGINSVPTAVVTADGKEIGRINGNLFKIPELAVNNVLMNIGG